MNWLGRICTVNFILTLKVFPGKHELKAFFNPSAKNTFAFEHSIIIKAKREEGEDKNQIDSIPSFIRDFLRAKIPNSFTVEYVFNAEEHKAPTRIFLSKEMFTLIKDQARIFNKLKIRRLLLQNESSVNEIKAVGSLCIKKNVTEVLCLVGKQKDLFAPIVFSYQGKIFRYLKLEKEDEDYIVNLDEKRSFREEEAFDNIPEKEYITQGIDIHNIKFKFNDTLYKASEIYWNIYNVSVYGLIYDYLLVFICLMLIILAIVIYYPVTAYFFGFLFLILVIYLTLK